MRSGRRRRSGRSRRSGKRRRRERPHGRRWLRSRRVEGRQGAVSYSSSHTPHVPDKAAAEAAATAVVGQDAPSPWVNPWSTAVPQLTIRSCLTV
jgi:hypothetical protein